LLLLHTPEVGASAYEMRGILELLAPYYRVYAPDLIGFGLSDHPRIDYSAETYIALCHDFLVDVVARPATVVASRVSCNYAVTVAATSPQLCERLVLISPVALYAADRRPALIASLVKAPGVKAVLYPLLSTRFALYYVLARQHPLKAEADLDHFYAATHQLGAEHAAMALLAGKLTYNVAEQFEKLQQPTLIIWGAHELNDSRRITDRHAVSEHARVVLLQNAGIAVHEEHPGEVVAAIQRWGEEGQQEIADTLPAQEPETPVAEQKEVNSPLVEAYCVKCKTKTEMRDAHEVTMKNGRVAIRGTCAVCGTNLFRIGRIVSEP